LIGAEEDFTSLQEEYREDTEFLERIEVMMSNILIKITGTEWL